MANVQATPDTYLAAVDNLKLKEVAEHLRTLIRGISPAVQERVRYGMLDYPRIGNMAVQKSYVALYLNQEVVAANQELLSDVDSHRSCLRFRSVEQIPDADIKALLHRAFDYEIDADAVARALM